MRDLEEYLLNCLSNKEMKLLTTKIYTWHLTELLCLINFLQRNLNWKKLKMLRVESMN